MDSDYTHPSSTVVDDHGTEIKDETWFSKAVVAEGSEEENIVYHYAEARRLLGEAEKTLTTSEADIYMRMAKMHMEIYSMLRSEFSGAVPTLTRISTTK